MRSDASIEEVVYELERRGWRFESTVRPVETTFHSATRWDATSGGYISTPWHPDSVDGERGLLAVLAEIERIESEQAARLPAPTEPSS